MRRVVLLVGSIFVIVGVLPSVAAAWTWPTNGVVLGPFVLGDDPYAGGQHRGIDVAGALADPVRAPADGVVSFAGTVPNGGKTVSILTSDGYTVTLLHLGSISVKKGDAVGEGATIGRSGRAASPSSPCRTFIWASG